jgi:hypothetical protein
VRRCFKNLYDFFNYIEFCPLCKNRLSLSASLFGTKSCETNYGELVFYPIAPDKKFSIDMLNNNVSESYADCVLQAEICRLIIARSCSKYHFSYNGVAEIHKDKLNINNICLDKYHFVRIHGPAHFTVNGSFIDNTTNIRITTPDFKTKELTLSLISFDFTSKKKIDSKLRNIRLLG